MVGTSVSEGSRSTPEIVAGRYEIESVIAKGGMGVVYRARDRTHARSVALKRLLSEGDTRRRARMFEREFYALSGLKHPRIIEVYEYGIDQGGAYYTMELLDGRDLRELAPLPYRTACRYLRDVANSLALLHARGLLHRDISPRNVRITADGRAKLIDFGTLSSFGRSAQVVGTAPGIPPETLYGAALDQRADLFSLGALAYWMVTGHHAYHVRNIDQLPEAWRKPLQAPSLLVPKGEGFEPLPPELDELILELLDQNPLARPVNGAEVVARLSAIAQLPSEDEPLSALSYLHGGKTVGRARQRAKLRKCVKSATHGRGSVVTLESETGMGSGRLLADLAIEARLLGATPIVVDASAQSGAFGVVEQIARALFEIDPEKARAAMGEHAPALARFVPGSAVQTSMRPALSKLDNGPDPREARMRVQTALLAWFERLAKQTPLVIGVRALHRVDDASAAFLSSLARGIEARRVVLVLAFDPEEAAGAGSVFTNLIETASVTLRLRGLSRDEVHALVHATFGAIRNSDRLAEWLHELTSGNPRGCIDLLQHLIEQQVIRFIDGVWVLPHDLTREALPTDIGQALDARLSRLSRDAYQLALALSVHRSATPLERCLAVARREGIGAPQQALSELAQRGVIVAGEDDVRFAHEAIHQAILRRLDAATRRRLHAQFGHLLEREGRDDPQALLDAGWHLLHGGEERRGAELLADLGAVRSSDDAFTDMMPALEAALDVYRRHGYPAREQARILTSLAAAGFFVDRKYSERYSDEALEMMQGVLGLSIARRWQPRVGARLGLAIGLGAAFLRMVFAKGPRMALRRFLEAITLFCTAAVSTAGHATLIMDPARARKVAAVLDPLRALGPDSAPYVLSEYARALATLPEDRLLSTIAWCRRVAARLEDPRPILGFTPDLRRMQYINVLYAWGALEGLREDPEALRIADELDKLGMQLANLYADQIRASYHGVRGESALADAYRKRVEVFALQAGSGWVAEIWVPTSAILFHLISRDGVGIRRVMGELERLGAEVPSLQRYARLARATYHSLHGDEVAVREALGDLIDAAPRSFIGWTAMMGMSVRMFARQGDLERARALGEAALAALDADDRRVTTMVVPLITELAMLDAETDPQAAARRIDDYLAGIAHAGGPVTLGTLHETRAQIALLAGDDRAAREHLAHVKRWFVPTENPVLISRCERLQREIASGSFDLGARNTADFGPTNVEAARVALRTCVTAKERAVGALDLLLTETGALSGYLFGCDESELSLLCQRGGGVPTADLRERVRRELEAGSTDHSSSSIATRVASPLPSRASREGAYRVILLADRKRPGGRAIAAAALSDAHGSLRAPNAAFLAAIADGLAEVTTASHSEHSV
jgi:tRNA A-37 threonylcarbamoyl transferase component Bud32